VSGGTDVTFVVVVVRLVIAFVRYLDCQQLKKKAVLDERMTIQIKMEVGDSSEEEDSFEEIRKKTIKAKGRLASNRLGIKADLSVLLDRPRKDLLLSDNNNYLSSPIYFCE
jgi:hypothetical protein